MRIALATSSYAPYVGGVGEHARNVARHLQEHGQDLVVRAINRERGVDIATVSGAEIQSLPAPLPARSATAWPDSSHRCHAPGAIGVPLWAHRPDVIRVNYSGPKVTCARILFRQYKISMVASTQREAITDDPSVVMRSRFAGWSLRLAQVPAASATGRSQLEIDYLRKTFRPQPEPETVVFNGIDLAECSGTPPESQQVGLCAAHCEIVEFIEYAVSDEPDWRDENQGPRTDPKAVTVGDRASNGLDDEETAGFGSISGIRGNCPITRLREESDISLRLGALEERIDFTPRAIAHHVVLRSRLYGFVSRLLRRNVQTTDISRRHSAHQTANRMRGHADGDADRPTFLRRVTAPVILTRSIAELSGLVIGFPAAVIARRRDRRNGVATP